MDVSENSGTPKSSILIGFSIINHPFWDTTIFGNTHMTKKPKSSSTRCRSGDQQTRSLGRELPTPHVDVTLVTWWELWLGRFYLGVTGGHFFQLGKLKVMGFWALEAALFLSGWFLLVFCWMMSISQAKLKEKILRKSPIGNHHLYPNFL